MSENNDSNEFTMSINSLNNIEHVFITQTKSAIVELELIFSRAYIGEFKGKKVSYVISRRHEFEDLKERCEKLTIPDDISIMLVDLAGHSVVAEYKIKKR